MRSNLYLIVINLILFFILLLGIVKTNTITPLSSLNTDQITALTLHRADKNSVQLIKQDNLWKLQDQDNTTLTDANNELVNSLLKLLNTPIHHSLQLSKQEWQKFSLEEPATPTATAKNSHNYLEISYQVDEQIKNTQIIFGQEESLSLLRYVRIEDQVYLINSYYYYLLFRDFQASISTPAIK